MAEETTLSALNLISVDDGNSSSSAGNDSNGTDSSSGYNRGLALFVLPQIPGWVAFLYLSMLSLSIIIGVPGNLITVAAYARIKAKTSCDWYILIVALTDLVACLSRNIVYIMEHCEVWLRYSNSDLCRFLSWFSQTTVCVSIFIFGLIAIDRYIKLCHTFKWNITPNRARYMCLIIVVVNSVLAAPCLYMFENLARGNCGVKRHLLTNNLVRGYYTLIFALFLLMFIAVVFCYVNIAIKVRKTKRIGDVAPASVSATSPHGRSGEEDEMSENAQNASKSIASGSFPAQQAGGGSPDTISSRGSKTGSCQNLDSTKTHPPAMTEHVPSNLHNPKQAGNEDKQVLGNENGAAPAAGDKNHLDVPQQQTKANAGASSHRESLAVPAETTGAGRRRQNENPALLLNQLQNKKAEARQQRNVRITGLLFVVTAVFILSWVPPYISMVKGFFIGYSFSFTMGEVLLINYGSSVYVINTFSNPIIYATMSATYRRHVVDLAKSLWKMITTVRCRW